MIAILLSTYNGEQYLKEQLNSLFNQTYKDFKIIVRDDGSSDNTLEILNSYDLMLLKSSKNVGVKKSFSILLEYAIHETDANHFMFCDQDDVWEEDKVKKTFQKMQEMEKKYKNKPLLIHTNLKVVDEKLNIINKSFWKYENINPYINAFNDLLLQNTVTGCTIMLNRKLSKLASPIPSVAIMHDYWFGLVASNFGKIGIVEDTTVLYRQHNLNTIGSNGFNFTYIVENFLTKSSIEQNILQAEAFLIIYRDKLERDSIDMLEEFIDIKSKSFLQKRKILLKHKLLKQGFLRNLGLFLKI